MAHDHEEGFLDDDDGGGHKPKGGRKTLQAIKGISRRIWLFVVMAIVVIACLIVWYSYKDQISGWFQTEASPAPARTVVPAVPPPQIPSQAVPRKLGQYEMECRRDQNGSVYIPDCRHVTEADLGKCGIDGPPSWMSLRCPKPEEKFRVPPMAQARAGTLSLCECSSGLTSR